jgi:hypothetical protein
VSVHGVLLPLNALHGREQLDDAALLVGVFLDVFDLFARQWTQRQPPSVAPPPPHAHSTALRKARTFGERAHHFFEALQFLEAT